MVIVFGRYRVGHFLCWMKGPQDFRDRARGNLRYIGLALVITER